MILFVPSVCFELRLGVLITVEVLNLGHVCESSALLKDVVCGNEEQPVQLGSDYHTGGCAKSHD